MLFNPVENLYNSLTTKEKYNDLEITHKPNIFNI